MGEYSLCRINHGVGELIINQPKQRNALIGPLIAELHSGLENLLADDRCQAIIIRGLRDIFVLAWI